MNFEEVTWGDIATLEYGKALRGYKGEAGPVPVYGSSGIVGWTDKFLADGPGVVIARKGSLGSHYSKTPFFVIDTAFFLRLKESKNANMRWAYYATKALDFRKLATGSAVPSLTRDHFYSVEVRVPPLETQRRIAAILGAYDDLIEVNRRRVAVLEEMARGLFEEWFVRFRFPGHETVPILDTPDGPLPAGWRWENLYDAAEVSFGFAFKSKAFTTERVGVPVVRIRDVQEGKTSTWTPEAFDDRYWVKNGDLLIGMDGIFHTNIWVGGDAALNQRVTRLRPKDGLSVGWLFRGVLPKIKFFEATISGTTVAHLGAKHLKTIMLPRADEATQRQADAFFAPIDAQLVNLKVANERLAASRDLLLPRLISGQLSVEGAERELEAAA